MLEYYLCDVILCSNTTCVSDVTGADPYIIAKCEKETVRIPTVEDTRNPEWDRSALFFKTNVSSTVEIEVSSLKGSA